MTNTAHNEQTFAPTHCLGLRGIAMTAVAFNRVCHSAGVIVRAWRESSKPGRDPKAFWKLTDIGHAYGIETISERNPNEVTVRWLDSKFDALLEVLQPTIAAMVHEGELAPIVRDAAKGDEYRGKLEAGQCQREPEAPEQF